jgi:hypothetical protein
MIPINKSLQGDNWDEGDILLSNGKNTAKNYLVTAEEINAVRRLLLAPIKKFNDKSLIKPRLYEHMACVNCSLYNVCKERVKLRLPVACEQSCVLDELFLSRYTEEKLKELSIVE